MMHLNKFMWSVRNSFVYSHDHAWAMQQSAHAWSGSRTRTMSRTKHQIARWEKCAKVSVAYCSLDEGLPATLVFAGSITV